MDYSISLNGNNKYILWRNTDYGTPIPIAEFWDGYDNYAIELGNLFDMADALKKNDYLMDLEIGHDLLFTCLEDTVKYLKQEGNRGLINALYRMETTLELIKSKQTGGD